MNDNEILTLWVGACRYYMGRMSYAVGDFCDLLIKKWPDLPERTKSIIKRDVETEIKQDNKDRSDGKEYKRLGHDCDRAQWDRVRKLWTN